jgi:RND family efflux transporter MFP subunit
MQSIVVSGQVIPRDTFVLAAEGDGYLTEVPLLGSTFKEEQTIARLDDVELQLDKERLLSKLDMLRTGLSQLNKQFGRIEQLAQQNSVSEELLENAHVQRINKRYDLIEAETELAKVLRDIEGSRLKSPFAAEVTDVYAERGQYIQAGQPILRLISIENLEVKAAVALDYYTVLLGNARAAVNYNGRSYEGQVQRMTRNGNYTAQSFDVFVVLDVPPINLPVNASLPLSISVDGESLREVPKQAIFFDSQGPHILSITEPDMVVDKSYVEIMHQNDSTLIVRSDLPIGSAIVIDRKKDVTAGEVVVPQFE